MNEYVRLHPEEFAAKGEWIFSAFAQIKDTKTQQ